jgi:GAF domain-containing protein
MSVRIPAGARMYGLLDVCTSGQRVFCPEELDFVDSMGRLLGAAIERDLAGQAGELLRGTELRHVSQLTRVALAGS